MKRFRKRMIYSVLTLVSLVLFLPVIVLATLSALAVLKERGQDL